jgi:hypothetical protein
VDFDLAYEQVGELPFDPVGECLVLEEFLVGSLGGGCSQIAVLARHENLHEVLVFEFSGVSLVEEVDQVPDVLLLQSRVPVLPQKIEHLKG